VPDTYTNRVLLGSLVGPVGALTRGRRREEGGAAGSAQAVSLGALPLGRRDVELLQQAVALQPRLAEPDALTPRTQRGLLHRVAFRDALAWLEIHGDAPDRVARWRSVQEEFQRPPIHALEEREAPPPEERQPRRRRRRRRRPPRHDERPS
jgi:hypothetical protein